MAIAGAAVLVIFLAACGKPAGSPIATPQPVDLASTQAALQATEAAAARQATLTAAASQATQTAGAQTSSKAQPTAEVTRTSKIYVDAPPTPTLKYGPEVAAFMASEDMFCRDAPSTKAEAHYTMPATESWPVLGRWTDNVWLLLSIDVPETRTKCCWVSGKGSLNVSLDSLPVIDYVPDRIECELK